MYSIPSLAQAIRADGHAALPRSSTPIKGSSTSRDLSPSTIALASTPIPPHFLECSSFNEKANKYLVYKPKAAAALEEPSPPPASQLVPKLVPLWKQFGERGGGGVESTILILLPDRDVHACICAQFNLARARSRQPSLVEF